MDKWMQQRGSLVVHVKHAHSVRPPAAELELRIDYKMPSHGGSESRRARDVHGKHAVQLNSGGGMRCPQCGHLIPPPELFSSGFCHSERSRAESDMFNWLSRGSNEKKLREAALEGNLSRVRELLKKDVDVNASNKDGKTALHLASWKGHVDVVRLLLSREANPNLLNKDGETPLALCFQLWPLPWEDDKKKVFWNTLETAHALLSAGATYDGPADIFPSVEEEHKDRAAIISMCIHRWTEEQQRKKRSLTAVPLEVFQRGSKAVETYLTELDASDVKDLVWRRKVCVVGSSRAGKSSLIKSITSMTSTLEKEDDRTIGVDLFRLEFKEEVDGGTTVKQRSHAVTFWDFAGQDEYHVAHTLFFSRRTLYLLCVDVKEFNEVVREAQECGDEDKAESLVSAFVQERVWRWIRLILARQPDAEFVLLATKTDALGGDAQARLDILERELLTVVTKLKKAYGNEIQRAIRALLEPPGNSKAESRSAARINILHSLLTLLETSVPTSWVGLNVRESSSVQRARTHIEDVVKQSNRSFLMPDKYSRVLHKVEELRETARRAMMKNRIRQSFVLVPDLVKVLMAGTDDLTEDNVQTILETLHDLGDVLWYARDGHHMLGDTIILDAELLIDFIRQIVCHDPSKIPGAVNPTDDREDPLVEEVSRHGIVSHELLRYRFSLWKRLEYPEQMLQFKLFLQYFNLAYPIGGGKMLHDSGLIVPAYWKVHRQVIDIGVLEPLCIKDTEPRRVAYFDWQYDLSGNSAEVVEAVFKLVAMHYSDFPGVKIRWPYIELALNQQLTIRVVCGMVGEQGPVIQLEVVGTDDQKPSISLRGLHETVEDVLKMFPGTLVTRYAVVNEHRYDLDAFIGLSRIQTQKLLEHPWLPDNVLLWFRRRPDLGHSVPKKKLSSPNQLETSRNKSHGLHKDTEQHVPRCWSVECMKNAAIVIKIYSELTGKCHHKAIGIPCAREIFDRYSIPIQMGLNVFVGAVPRTIFKRLREELKFDSTEQVTAFTTRSGVLSEKEHYVHPRTIDKLLVNLLQFYAKEAVYTNVPSLCNLECVLHAVLGVKLWAHLSEMREGETTTRERNTNVIPSNSHREHPEWIVFPEEIAKEEGPLLAEGSFGKLYFAKWQRKRIVVKELKTIADSNLEIFRNEIKLWYRLRHPNIVPFFGANDQPPPPYFIVSAYASNGELVSYLQREKKRYDVTWRKILEVADGLSYLHHMKIVHGDLKGNNILVSESGTAMLVDFGLSSSILDSGSPLIEHNDTLSAMAWRAPEVARGEPPTPKSDVYSLGMCIIEVMTGESPWCEKTHDDVIRESLRKNEVKAIKPCCMQDDEWGLVQQMISVSPDDRPSMKEVTDNIEVFANEEQRREDIRVCPV